MNQIVVTDLSDGTDRRLLTRRLAAGRFATETVLEAGTNVISVVANPASRARARAVFELEIPPG